MTEALLFGGHKREHFPKRNFNSPFNLLLLGNQLKTLMKMVKINKFWKRFRLNKGQYFLLVKNKRYLIQRKYRNRVKNHLRNVKNHLRKAKNHYRKPEKSS